MPIAFLPVSSAATRVVPLPAKGSSMVSSFAVAFSTCSLAHRSGLGHSSASNRRLGKPGTGLGGYSPRYYPRHHAIPSPRREGLCGHGTRYNTHYSPVQPSGCPRPRCPRGQQSRKRKALALPVGKDLRLDWVTVALLTQCASLLLRFTLRRAAC